MVLAGKCGYRGSVRRAGRIGEDDLGVIVDEKETRCTDFGGIVDLGVKASFETFLCSDIKSDTACNSLRIVCPAWVSKIAPQRGTADLQRAEAHRPRHFLSSPPVSGG